MGKKASGESTAAVNSMDPLPFALSMTGMTHVSIPSRLLKLAPSPSVTVGASAAGTGMEMCTSRSSMWFCCSSYSTLTVKPPASCVGQQLMSRGTRLSSVVARRHLSTPRAEPVGKALEGSLRPRVDSAEKSCLLMLGCVLNWKPGFSPMRSGSVTLPMAESVMSSVRSPLTSIDSSPPSRFIETTTFSSTVSWMASLITRLAGAAPPAPPAGPAGLPGMPMGASSTSPVSTSCCSREAPPPIVFLPSAMPVPLASGFWYVGGRSMPMPPMPPMPIDESIPAPLGIVTGPADEMPGISDDGIEPMPPLLPRAPPLLRAISFSFSLAFSRASRSLLCRIIRLSFSSCDSISMLIWMSRIVTFSLCPIATTSSKANTSSKACLHTLASSISPGQYSVSTLAKSRSSSRSATMLECLLVISSTIRFSIGW
mmetsp:Transcript_10892/g.25916  ORF Transcript_10892/g.25916 Transcript_10892/m.25916 type:complete len:427 (-) Transcript_10892:235-1515(-)